MQSKRPIIILATALALALALAGGATAAPMGEVPPPSILESLPGVPPELELPPVEPPPVEAAPVETSPVETSPVEADSVDASSLEELPAAPADCRVPDVRSKTLFRAAMLLGAAGCSLGTVTEAPSPRAKKGHVVAQGVAPGTQLPNGSNVRLTLASGKTRKTHR